MIGFVAAEVSEFSGLRRHLRNEKRPRLQAQWTLSGELNGRHVILVANGPGPALARRAAEAIEELRNLETLVSYGFCGALDPDLRVNDIFIASEVQSIAGTVACDELRRRPSAWNGTMPAPQRLISMDRVAITAIEKSKLYETGAKAVEMEAGGVGAHAASRHLPFHCIRVVTDSASDEFALDFNQLRDQEGRFSRAKILASAARRPLKLIPDLIRLNRRAARAAQTLGDFVASCEF